MGLVVWARLVVWLVVLSALFFFFSFLFCSGYSLVPEGIVSCRLLSLTRMPRNTKKTLCLKPTRLPFSA